MSSALPEGWTWTTLAEICSKPQYGWTTSARKAAHGLKLLRTTDISSGEIDWLTVPVCTEEPPEPGRYLLQQGDVVISRAGSVGISHVLGDCPRAAFASYLIRFRPLDGIPSQFLGLFLRSSLYWDAITEETAGIAIPNVNGSKLAALSLPLPPLAEQRRIVETADTLLARANAARDRLAKVAPILKRFRQSVLAAACSGRLTEDWRDLHPELKPPSIPTSTPRAHNARRKGANLSGDEDLLVDDEMPELPATWTYARVDRLVEPGTVITYGIVLPGPETPGGVPYVRQQDIENGAVLVEQLRHTSSKIANRHERSRLEAGDVLLCIIRNLRVAVVPEGIDGANLTQGTVRIRVRSDLLLNSYLAAYLTSPHAQGWMTRRYFGMDMPRINVEDARAVPVALPSPEEQREIVIRVRNLFDLADAIERRVAASIDRADKLIQAILAKAFRGKLVPTEAELARNEGRDYEPASALLERIRQRTTERDPKGRAGRLSQRRRRE